MSTKKRKAKDARPKPAPEKAKADPEGEAAPDAEATAPENAGPESETAEESGWAAGELEALRAENEDLKDKLLRTVAEMENLRRRTERDKADTAKYAVSNFARDVLTIADNIQRAIAHVPEEAAEKDETLKSFLDGINVTERELLNVMERHGIQRVNPKGERFDPNLHQAMFEVPDTSVAEGTIMEVVQAGYVIADRVLRPAMVGVSKGGEKKPAKAEAEPAAANDDTPADGPEGPGDGGSGSPKGNVGAKVDKSA